MGCRRCSQRQLTRAESASTRGEIARYIDGQIDSQLKARVFAHLDRCSDCRVLLSSVARSEADSSEDSASGPRVGRFILRKVIGEGAMGIVYLAYDPQLKRHVAVKLLRPDTEHTAADQRLVIEAQTAAQLSHPNAVVVYDAGTDNGQPYVAMEYVEGSTAGQWLRRGGISWQSAVDVMLAAGEGLAAAHRAGLVHRDFKPGNILLGSDGQVKVTDFGLAQFDERAQNAIAAHEEALNIPRSQRHVTQPGILVGTPAYTSPEQYKGHAATALSDQFSFAVTLYAAVYGRRPFHGKTPYELYRAVADSEPDEPGPESPVPIALWSIVARGLAKDPRARFESMDALLTALRSALGTESSSGRLTSGDRCPFPGLAAFGETDAGVFFGRDRELADFIARLNRSGTASVVGPSGAGKSSFVQALAIPQLRQDNPMCEVLMLRPGGRPFDALARLVAPLVTDQTSLRADELAQWLRREPERLLAVLLSRARHYNATIILYIDQLEELFAQVEDPRERAAFADCISLVGLDASRPLRLVTSLRSDFLDRAGESGPLMERITAGFVFLATPRRESLIEAITGPLAAVGYRLEDAQIAELLADELSGTSSALPLLQFIAQRLWEDRDRDRRVITRSSLESMGSLAGALATHADTVLSQLTHSGLRIARSILLRLVTGEGTKRAATLDELADLATDHRELERVVELLVTGRLLTAEKGVESDSPALEIVHETLITHWPTLRRWFEDQVGDTALIADIGVAARRWHSAGRSDGLLWRGDQAGRVKGLLARQPQLTGQESSFAEAVVRSSSRAANRRRLALVTLVVILVAIAGVATAGLLVVRDAEQSASRSADAAERDAERARAAEKVAADQLAAVKAAQAMRDEAREDSERAKATVLERDKDLAKANKELRRNAAELEKRAELAEELREKAEKATAEARRARRATEAALADEKRRRKSAEKAAKKIIEDDL